MSRVRGIAKNMSALFTGHGINVLQQLVLTPLFIAIYGKVGFGEWQVLSAAVSYLGTLDFGVTTYVNQDLTVRYHRGDMDDFHVQQSTALRLLLGICVATALLGLIVFALPMQHILKMDTSAEFLDAGVVQRSVFLLGLQVVTSILFGFIAGNFMVVGRAYIGGYWNNVKNLLIVLSGITCVSLHSSFVILALSQFLSVLVCLLGALITLYRVAPQIFPTLRYFDAPSVPRILNRSIYYVGIYSSNFLIYQVPILILYVTVGAVAVTLFTIMRQPFSMTRQMLNAPSLALGPEVTTLHARNDWPRLVHLYEYSERLIFSMIAVANVAVYMLCPILLVWWLHRTGDFFMPGPYMLAAAISVVISVKEHKQQFLFSTNTHVHLARMMLASYILMCAAWMWTIPHYSLTGLLATWLAVEFFQLIYIFWLNTRFFAAHAHLHVRYLASVIIVSAAFLVAGKYLLPIFQQKGTMLYLGYVAAYVFALFLIDYVLFGLTPIITSVYRRLRPAAG